MPPVRNDYPARVIHFLTSPLDNEGLRRSDIELNPKAGRCHRPERRGQIAGDMDMMSLELLRQSVHEWNASRKEHPEVAVELTKVDLRNADLSGADLSGAKMNGANLSGASLKGADLHDARLFGVLFSGADLAGANLSRSHLCGVSLDGANLAMADLSEVDLKDGNLSGALLKGANLSDARLNGANLSESDLRDACLNGADLSGAGLSMADLEDADLRDVKLAWADLIGANLTDTDLSMADLHDADLRDANLRDADLHDAKLADTDLSMAELGDADLEDADLRDAKLRWTKLNGAILAGADLGMANLNGAELRGAILSGANLTGVNLCDAILDGAQLDGVSLEGADLSMASIAGTEIGFAKFINVDLSNIKGTESALFTGPSEISASTLFRSRGKIPEAFLAGCGMPDTFIRYVSTLSVADIDHYSCFILFAARDRPFAERLHGDLQAAGIRCWLQTGDARKSQVLHPAWASLERFHEKLLLVLSGNSLKSEWVKSALAVVRGKEEREGRRLLVTASLLSPEHVTHWRCVDGATGCDMAMEVRRRPVPCFCDWEHDPETYAKGFAGLMEQFREDGARPA